MNEDLKVMIKKHVTLACCNEDKKCEVCKPIWQRTLILDDSLSFWFPVIGMTNKVLKKLAKSELGLLVENNTGVWYVQEQMALEVAATKKEAQVIKEICDLIRSKYKE